MRRDDETFGNTQHVALCEHVCVALCEHVCVALCKRTCVALCERMCVALCECMCLCIHSCVFIFTHVCGPSLSHPTSLSPTDTPLHCTALTATVTTKSSVHSTVLPADYKVHAIKAYTDLGPFLYLSSFAPPFSSSAHNAPVVAPNYSTAFCQAVNECTSEETPLSASLSTPAGSTAAPSCVGFSQFANKTAIISWNDLIENCDTSPFFDTPAAIYLAFKDAGAAALIMVTLYDVPGGWSNLLTANRRASDSGMPFVAIGGTDGMPLLDVVVSVEDFETNHETNPETAETVHVTFSFDENKFIVMYDNWLHYLYKVVVGGLAAAALYKWIVVFNSMMSMSTGTLVLFLEFPTIICLLNIVIKGPVAYEPVSSLRFLTVSTAFPFSGMFSKFLVAHFWSSYLAGVNGKFVDPVCR